MSTPTTALPFLRLRQWLVALFVTFHMVCVVVYALLRITGLVGAVGLIAAGAATVVTELRGS